LLHEDKLLLLCDRWQLQLKIVPAVKNIIISENVTRCRDNSKVGKQGREDSIKQFSIHKGIDKF